MDIDEDRLTLGTSEVTAPLQLTTPQSDEDGTWYFSSHATRWLPSPWKMQQSVQPRSGRRTASVLSFRNLLSVNVSYGAFTVPSGCANWSDRRATTKLSALRLKINVLSSSFLAVLCPLSTYFSLFRTSSTYLIGRSYNTVLVSKSFHNVQP